MDMYPRLTYRPGGMFRLHPPIPEEEARKKLDEVR